MLRYRRRLLSTPSLSTVWWAPVPAGTITRAEFFDVATGDQTITGALFTDSDTFGAGVITLAGGPQTITGALFTDQDSFGAGAVTASYTITGVRFVDPDTFGAGTILQAGPQTIIGALFVDLDTFGSGVITAVGAASPAPRVQVVQPRLVLGASM